jgi:glucokinase
MATILAGDIGGTNTRLALYKSSGRNLKFVSELTYPSRNYPGLAEIVVAFVRQTRAKVDLACFGIAGPVKEGRSVTSNLAWIVDAQQLANVLKLQKAFLLNDLESIAYGTLALTPQDCVTLREGTAFTGNRAIIAAGTGLGEAGLFWDGSTHRPLASEGGHADFAARNELEIELLRFLISKFQHVSYERILSGPGLVNLYEFFRDAKREPEPPWLREELAQSDPGVVISRNALSGKSPLCERALTLFVQIYGAEAGNTVMRFMAVNGLYIAGGIAAKILPMFSRPEFLDAFDHKGRLQKLLALVPVRVVTNEKVGLLGAAHFAVSTAPFPLGAPAVETASGKVVGTPGSAGAKIQKR